MHYSVIILSVYDLHYSVIILSVNFKLGNAIAARNNIVHDMKELPPPIKIWWLGRVAPFTYKVRVVSVINDTNKLEVKTPTRYAQLTQTTI